MKIFGIFLMVLSFTFASNDFICKTDKIAIEQAKTGIELLLESDPQNVTCLLRLASINLEQGKISKGFELLVRASEIDPKVVEKHSLLALFPFALKVTNMKKQAQEKNDKELWNQLGDRYFEMGIFEDATVMYKKSIAIDANQPDIRVKMALGLRKNTNIYCAIDELKKVVQDNEFHFYANYYLGKILQHDIKDNANAMHYFIVAKESLEKLKSSFSFEEYQKFSNEISREIVGYQR
ncbi:MAG: hypothetical protein PHW07_01305 [Sulfurospirillaceae bacterium]|nr:hypothetical protein [Sulfurospirillaceae bacterium]